MIPLYLPSVFSLLARLYGYLALSQTKHQLLVNADHLYPRSETSSSFITRSYILAITKTVLPSQHRSYAVNDPRTTKRLEIAFFGLESCIWYRFPHLPHTSPDRRGPIFVYNSISFSLLWLITRQVTYASVGVITVEEAIYLRYWLTPRGPR